MLRRAQRYPRRIRLAQALPSSVEDVIILDAWPVVISQLREIADERDAKFPRLETLRVRCEKNASKHTQRPLKKAFERLGISLRIANLMSPYEGHTTDDEEFEDSDVDSIADDALDPGSPSFPPQQSPTLLPDSWDIDGRREAFRRELDWMYRNAEESSGPDTDEEYPRGTVDDMLDVDSESDEDEVDDDGTELDLDEDELTWDQESLD